MDTIDDCDPPVGKPNPLANWCVGIGLLLLLIGPGFLWYWTDDSYWALGWALLIILGLAG